MLECSETDAGLVLFTDAGPNTPISVKRKPLLEAFRVSVPLAESALNTFIASGVLALLPVPPDAIDMDATVDIDLGAFPWPFIVQDIVSRSPTLSEVTVIQWMNHPSLRLETYGASVSLITAKAIHHATSEDILARFRLQDRGLSLPGPLPAASLRTPASDGHRLLTVGEVEAGLCIWEAMLYLRGLHEDGRAVPDGIAQMSRLWDETGWQVMRLCVLEIVPLVQDTTPPSPVLLRMADSPSISTSFRQSWERSCGSRTDHIARANRRTSSKASWLRSGLGDRMLRPLL